MSHHHATEELNALNQLRQIIQENQEQDPYIAAKIASDVLLNHVVHLLNGEQTSAETLFAVLGRLAGYTCQQIALSLSDDELQHTDSNGKTHYAGQAIDDFLFHDDFSLWSLLIGMTEHLGETAPDLDEIKRYVAQSENTESFGLPRFPIQHLPSDTLAMWQQLRAEILAVLPVPTYHWVFAYGVAIQSLMEQTQAVLPCQQATQLVMECAIPMSQMSFE